MTQRAYQREIYKQKKRLPAPEVPKPKPHHKGEKVWYIQSRYTQEVWERMVAEDKRRQEQFGNNRWMWCWTRGKNNDWVKKGKYYDKETAEKVMNQDLRHQKEHPWGWAHEYRVIHKDDLQKEKDGRTGNKV